jgi:hypothetical protein
VSINYVKPVARIDYTRPARRASAVTCLHHATIARVRLVAETMHRVGFEPSTAGLSQLPACTCR